MKKIISFTAALALLLILAPTSFAAEFIAPQGESGNVTLPAETNHRNVYVAGGNVVVNSTISGDLFAAGGNISVDGSVEQDVTIAGGNITLNGSIGGDLRIAGGTITVNGPIGGDILMAGGMLNISDKSSVGGDLYLAGGEVEINAPVAGTVKMDAGIITLNSSMSGEVKITSSQSLTIKDKAVIPGGIAHRGVQEATVSESAQVGEINYEKIQAPNHVGKKFASIFTIAFVIKILALILAGWILFKLFPKTGVRTLEYMQKGMWKNLGIGFLTLVVGPIAFILALVTFVGMYIAFIWLALWVLAFLIAVLVTNMFVGAWLLKMLSSSRQALVYDWQALVIGTVVVAIVVLVPVIGGLAFFILMLMAFGGIIRQLYAHIHSEQSAGHVGDAPHNY